VDQAAAYAEIMHRAMVEDGFAEALSNFTEAGRSYLQNSPLSGPALYEILGLLRLSLKGVAVEEQSAAPTPPPSEPPPPEPPVLEEAKIAFAMAQRKQAQDAEKDTIEVAADMKGALCRTIRQMNLAFFYTMLMYIVSFVMGVSLIVAGIVSAFTGYGKDSKWLSMVLGAMGAATTLAFFFTKPPERLQSSRASLAQFNAPSWLGSMIS